MVLFGKNRDRTALLVNPSQECSKHALCHPPTCTGGSNGATMRFPPECEFGANAGLGVRLSQSVSLSLSWLIHLIRGCINTAVTAPMASFPCPTRRLCPSQPPAALSALLGLPAHSPPHASLSLSRLHLPQQQRDFKLSISGLDGVSAHKACRTSMSSAW